MRSTNLAAAVALWVAVASATPAAEEPAGAAEERKPAASEGDGGERGKQQEEEDARRIEELERRLRLLTEEFDRLRRGAEPDEEAAEPGAGTGRYGLGPAASRIYRKERGVSIGGYGEWLYQNFDGELDDGTPSATEDTADFLRLVLYTGYKFGEKVLLNSELEFEHATTDEAGEVSVEFAYLDFFVRPWINVRTGLVLVPVGLMNEIHEPTTFPGARRPGVESVILPTTWRELGAGVFGESGPVTYRAYLTTSLEGAEFSAASGIRGGRQQGSEAVAEDLALSARVDYEGIPGLLVGASAFRGDSGQGEMVAGSRVGGTVTTLDLHADWRWRGLELRGLWARVDVDDAEQLSALAGETIGSRMRGSYCEAGYDVLAATRFNRFQLVPFVRVERFDTQDEVPAALAGTVTGENDRDATTFGLVFKPIPQVAVKLDYENLDNAAGSGQGQFNVAVGFAF